MRVVIWAGVSSRPQAELDSIDQQIADGQQWAEAQGAEVVATLVVPGVTRNFIDFYDALQGLGEFLRPGEHNAYRELEGMLAGKALDLLWMRGRDRLGRTDSLIAGIEERCRRAGVRLHSQAMPSSGNVAGDLYTSAIERASAQREIVELVRRNRYGMDARAGRGLPMGGPMPFGYRAQQEPMGSRLVRIAVPEPAELDAYRWLVACTLDASMTQAAMVERLAARFPERSWTGGSLLTILANPFYAGIVLRRRARQEGETALLRVVKPLDDPGWPEAERVLLRRVQAGGFLFRDERDQARVAVVSAGIHEAAVDLATWLELQRLLDLRAGTKRPPSPAALWGGILRCGRCGARMIVHQGGARRGHPGRYLSYACGLRRTHGRDACANPITSERKVTAQIIAYLTATFEARAGYLSTWTDSSEQTDLVALLAREAADLQERLDRLALLFETGRIDLPAFDRRAADLRASLERVKGQRAGAERALAGEAESQRRAALLADILPALAGRLEGVEPRQANRWLRQVFTSIYLVDGAVTGVEL